MILVGSGFRTLGFGLQDPDSGIWLWGLRFRISDFRVEDFRFTVNPSVVGSGPMRMPGKFWPRSERMKDVLPTEYCPSNSTCK